MNEEIEHLKLIMTFYGVDILARVKSDNEEDLAKLNIISSIIQNAFIPKSVKDKLEQEKVLK